MMLSDNVTSFNQENPQDTIHVSHHRAALIRFVKRRAKALSVNACPVSLDHQMVLDVGQNVPSALIVHLIRLVRTPSALILVQECVDLVLSVQ